MPPRSIAGVKGYIQRETTPGTPKTDAMIYSGALKYVVGWDADVKQYRGGTGKVVTGNDVDIRRSPIDVMGLECFRSIGLALASAIARPTTTTPVGATLARQHVGEINPDGVDDTAKYSLIVGDDAQAVQTSYAVFQGITASVQRGNLSLTSKMLGRGATMGATIPSTGVVQMPQDPIPVKKFGAYLDTSFAGLGGSKLLAFYQGGITVGERFDEDTPVDPQYDSYAALLEKKELESSANYLIGFDSVAVAQRNNWDVGSFVFLCLRVIDPVPIEGSIYPQLDLWASLQITKLGQIKEAPNSPAVTLGFEATPTKDPVSGKYMGYKLVNDILGY